MLDLVCEIIPNGFCEPIFELYLRDPTEFHLDLGGIYSIPLVVSWAISHELDHIFSLPHLSEYHPSHFEIGTLIAVSDIVDASSLRITEDFPECDTMIIDMEPIPDIAPVAIECHMLSCLEEADEAWDELLLVLTWAIVVGAAGDDSIDVIGPYVCLHEHIARCFGSAVWTRRIDRGCLSEESLVREVAIDLIS